MSLSFEFVTDRFRRLPRLSTAYWRDRRQITKKDQGTLTVRQLMDYLETQGEPMRICVS